MYKKETPHACLAARRGVAMPPQYIFGRGRAQSTYFYARVYFDIFIRVNLILETNTSISLQI